MNLHWFLRYLFIALECDSPILEATWIASDRAGEIAEFNILLPPIVAQLQEWEYIREPDTIWSKYFLTRYYTCQKLEHGVGFHITADGEHHEFYVIIDYPTNSYWHRYWRHQSEQVCYFTNRVKWLACFFQQLTHNGWIYAMGKRTSQQLLPVGAWHQVRDGVWECSL
jgi:hypothetical protein